MTVTITAATGKISVASPFNASFPERAHNLGGKWQGGRWVFDQRVEADVRGLCIEFYGTDGAAPADTVDVRVFITDAQGWGSIPFRNVDLTATLAGRPVARAYDRDSGAKTMEGVIVRQGGWTSGGSRKNPTITLKNGVDTEVEILDVPRPAAEALIADYPGMVSIIERPTVEAPAEPEAAPMPAAVADKGPVIGPFDGAAAAAGFVETSLPITPASVIYAVHGPDSLEHPGLGDLDWLRLLLRSCQKPGAFAAIDGEDGDPDATSIMFAGVEGLYRRLATLTGGNPAIYDSERGAA